MCSKEYIEEVKTMIDAIRHDLKLRILERLPVNMPSCELYVEKLNKCYSLLSTTEAIPTPQVAQKEIEDSKNG